MNRFVLFQQKREKKIEAVCDNLDLEDWGVISDTGDEESGNDLVVEKEQATEFSKRFVVHCKNEVEISSASTWVKQKVLPAADFYGFG